MRGSVGFEPCLDGIGEAAADAWDGGEGVWGEAADSGDGAEAGEEGAFSGFGDAGDVVEDAFADAAFHEELVVAVGPAVGFVADALEEAESAGGVREDEGIGGVGAEDFLAFFG